MKFRASHGDSTKNLRLAPGSGKQIHHLILNADRRIVARTEQSRLSRNRTGLKTFVLPIIHKPSEISRMPHLILRHDADKLPDRDD